MRRDNQKRNLQSCKHFVRWYIQRTCSHTIESFSGKLLHHWYKIHHKVRLTVILWCLIANHHRKSSYRFLLQLRSDYREDKHLKQCHLWWLQCYQTSSSCLTELPDTFGIRSFSWCEWVCSYIYGAVSRWVTLIQTELKSLIYSSSVRSSLPFQM